MASLPLVEWTKEEALPSDTSFTLRSNIASAIPSSIRSLSNLSKKHYSIHQHASCILRARAKRSVFLSTARCKEKQQASPIIHIRCFPIWLMTTLLLSSTNSFSSMENAAQNLSSTYPVCSLQPRVPGLLGLLVWIDWHKVPKPNRFLLIFATRITPCSRTLCQPRAHWQDVRCLIIPNACSTMIPKFSLCYVAISFQITTFHVVKKLAHE